MTAETDLLPLPEPDYLMPQGQGWPDIPAWSENTVRQIVAHATAPLQAEIEALRAEVERWRFPCREWLDKTEWVQQTVKPRELGHHRADILRQRIEQAEARAERLEKTLGAYQAAVNKIDDLIEYALPMPPETKAALYEILADLTAALAQETTNG